MSKPARSSICEQEVLHCPAAAEHAMRGTHRDRRPLSIGVCVHHMLEAAIRRPEGELETETIDRAAKSVLANGRSFEGGPVEYPTAAAVDAARDLALDFLDREEIADRANVDWIKAELAVDLNRNFARAAPGEDVLWRQALDCVALYRESIDDEELVVVEGTDWKGWNNDGEAWAKSLQGKGAAVSLAALCPQADVVRRRIVSYQPSGRSWSRDLHLSDHDDMYELEDYRRSIEVASAGHRSRAGKDPDELAQPGAGCSAGVDGCPYFTQCRPGQDWAKKMNLTSDDGLAKTWSALEALRKVARPLIAAKIDNNAPLETSDGRTAIGWKLTSRQEPSDDAAFYLSQALGEAGGKLESVLSTKGVLGTTTVKSIINRLKKDGASKEEVAKLYELCLVPVPARKLDVWKP